MDSIGLNGFHFEWPTEKPLILLVIGNPTQIDPIRLMTDHSREHRTYSMAVMPLLIGLTLHSRFFARGHEIMLSATKTAGGRLNKKDGLTRYGDSHVKDKTS